MFMQGLRLSQTEALLAGWAGRIDVDSGIRAASALHWTKTRLSARLSGVLGSGALSGLYPLADRRLILAAKTQYSIEITSTLALYRC